MDQLEQYQGRAIALMDAFQNHIADITDGDTIDYQEALHTRGFLENLAGQLRQLRREIIFARRDIRADHNTQILNTNGHDKEKRRAEKFTALRPYEQLLLSLDQTLKTVSDFGQTLSQSIPKFEQAMQNAPTEASIEVNLVEQRPDAEINNALLERLNRWRSVRSNLESKLASAGENVGEVAYLRGALKLLDIVIADVESLVVQENELKGS
jgi:hypothetical protein